VIAVLAPCSNQTYKNVLIGFADDIPVIFLPRLSKVYFSPNIARRAS
jgi:hypothetical protein